MSTASAASSPAQTANPFPYAFDKLQPQFIVTVVNQVGLYEVLAEADNGQWVLRSLNGDKLPLVTVEGDVRGFDLPIHHCFASRNRNEIVALVSGDDYDVTDNEDDEAAPLFQAVQAAELALQAGFTAIELTNGYDAWEGEIGKLLDECRTFMSEQGLSV